MFLQETATAGNDTIGDGEDINSEDFQFKQAFEAYWRNQKKQFGIINQHISLPDFAQSKRIFG